MGYASLFCFKANSYTLKHLTVPGSCWPQRKWFSLYWPARPNAGSHETFNTYSTVQGTLCFSHFHLDYAHNLKKAVADILVSWGHLPLDFNPYPLLLQTFLLYYPWLVPMTCTWTLPLFLARQSISFLGSLLGIFVQWFSEMLSLICPYGLPPSTQQ